MRQYLLSQASSPVHRSTNAHTHTYTRRRDPKQPSPRWQSASESTKTTSTRDRHRALATHKNTDRSKQPTQKNDGKAMQGLWRCLEGVGHKKICGFSKICEPSHEGLNHVMKWLNSLRLTVSTRGRFLNLTILHIVVGASANLS